MTGKRRFLFEKEMAAVKILLLRRAVLNIPRNEEHECAGFWPECFGRPVDTGRIREWKGRSTGCLHRGCRIPSRKCFLQKNPKKELQHEYLARH